MNTKLLRQKILDLAIRGKLIDQRKSDGTAADLLKEIAEAKSKKNGVILSGARSAKSKDPEQIIPLDKSEAPFEIPENWEWVRLGDLMTKVGAGSTPTGGRNIYETSGIKFIRSQNVYNDGLRLDDVVFIKPEIHSQKLGSRVIANDMLLNITGASIGRCAIVPADFDEANVNQHVLILRLANPKVLKFVHIVITSQFVFNQIMGAQVGGTKEGLSAERAKALQIPLPPLAEQQRIVEKIEEAFAEIEAVEKNKELLKTHIKQTRQKILDLAIHGKLVPQDENDEPASVLLEKILQEKAQSDNKKSQKKKKIDSIATSDNRPYEKITVENEPFEIPSSWKWVKLKSVCDDFIVPQRDKPTEFTGNIPWCRIEDIEGKYLNGSKSNQLVSKELADKMNMHLCPKGTVISACSASIGNQAITTVDCYTNQTFIGIVCNKALLFNEYLYYFLNSQSKLLKDMGKGTTIGYISRKKYEDYAIPLPPLAEQKRIVSKIEESFKSLGEIFLHLI